MGYILKHSIEETAKIINSLDINQFNSDRKGYYIESVEFINEGMFPSIHFVIRNSETNVVDNRYGQLRKVPNYDEVEYRDGTVKMYDGIIWTFLKEADITV